MSRIRPQWFWSRWLRWGMLGELEAWITPPHTQHAAFRPFPPGFHAFQPGSAAESHLAGKEDLAEEKGLPPHLTPSWSPNGPGPCRDTHINGALMSPGVPD